jgi:hypothetical protein
MNLEFFIRDPYDEAVIREADDGQEYLPFEEVLRFSIRHELITDLDMQRDIIDAGYLITSWDTTGDGVTGTLRLER